MIFSQPFPAIWQDFYGPTQAILFCRSGKFWNAKLKSKYKFISGNKAYLHFINESFNIKSSTIFHSLQSDAQDSMNSFNGGTLKPIWSSHTSYVHRPFKYALCIFLQLCVNSNNAACCTNDSRTIAIYWTPQKYEQNSLGTFQGGIRKQYEYPFP